MTVFDRVSEWFSIGAALALLACLQLGLVGPRWELFCDDEPCGVAPADATTFDLRSYHDGREHVFGALYARGQRKTVITQGYTWDGGQTASIGWSRTTLTVGPGQSRAGLVSPWYAMQLRNDGTRRKLQALIGWAVPRGGERVRPGHGRVECLGGHPCEYPDEGGTE